MTVSEAILTLNANVVIACERAGFSPATVKMVEDALDTIEDALKEQEPVKPIMRHVVFEYDTSSGWENKMYCPKCKMEMLTRVNYCPKCGQAVKWE